MTLQPKKSRSRMTGTLLTLVSPGTRARVVSTDGGSGFNQRLASMGIRPGVELRLMKGGPNGPVIIEVLGSRLVLGHGMAQRVFVEPAS